MSWIGRLRSLFEKQKLEDQLDQELQFHIEMRTQEFVASGITPEEARHKAQRLFGNQTQPTSVRRLSWRPAGGILTGGC